MRHHGQRREPERVRAGLHRLYPPDREHPGRPARVFFVGRPGAGPKKPRPVVTIGASPLPVIDPAQSFEYDKNGRFQGVRIRKPRVPWDRRPRRHTGLNLISCGNRRLTSKLEFTAQFKAAWFKKNCTPRRTTREFNPGGNESGTLAGARRAEGLFDYGWGTEFPLTRAEQKKLQEGTAVPDPFFAPPTTANPGNWIADRIELLRRRMQPTEYQTASDIAKLCGPGGNGITCEGPDGGVSWSSTTQTLTPEIIATFRATYCDIKTCQAPGSVTPPAGWTQRVIKGRPRNPAVRRRTNCFRTPEADITQGEYPPLPDLTPIPSAEAAPANCGPDIIVGRDDGPFASGWFFVLRCGYRIMVPNPLT